MGSVDAPPTVTQCSSNAYLQVNGTPDNWEVVTYNNPNDRCRIAGSYFVVQNSLFTDKLQLQGPGPYAVRNNEFRDFGSSGGGAINPQSGTDVLIEGNNIHDWGPIPSSLDQQGINMASSVTNLWVLSNRIDRVSGDGIQGCHGCVNSPGQQGITNMYIAGNVMNDNEENALDFKEFIGPIVVVCNFMSGYERGVFSGNGEAVRVNDEGLQGELWMSKNTYSNNVTDIAPYSSEALGYYLDEIGVQRFNDNERSNTQAFVSGAEAKPFYDFYQQKYGLDLEMPCPNQ